MSITNLKPDDHHSTIEVVEKKHSSHSDSYPSHPAFGCGQIGRTIFFVNLLPLTQKGTGTQTKAGKN